MKRLNLYILTTLALLPLIIPLPARATPKLWGVDADDFHLFLYGDYENMGTTFTNYGAMQWDNAGTPTAFLTGGQREMESFCIDYGGIAYFIYDGGALGGGYGDTVLLTLDLNQVSTASTPVATVVGDVGGTYSEPTGLAIHPISCLMYMTGKDGNNNTSDELYLIDKVAGGGGSVGTQLIGEMTGNGLDVLKAEDLAFTLDGTLYVTSDRPPVNVLHEVDPATGIPLALIDNNMQYVDGDESETVKFEGLAWDHENSQLISSDTDHGWLVEITLGNGNNANLGTIDDALDMEGFDFPLVPEPGLPVLSLLAAWGLLRRKSR